MFELRLKTKRYWPPGKWFYGPAPLLSGISWASDPHPPGISNSLRGGGLDIFWNHTLMIFIQKQILLLLTLLSAQESQFQQRENLKSVLLPGASPPGPLTGHCPCTPPPVAVTFSYSPATWNLFDNPGYWLIWMILNIGLVWPASSNKR